MKPGPRIIRLLNTIAQARAAGPGDVVDRRQRMMEALLDAGLNFAEAVQLACRIIPDEPEDPRMCPPRPN